jgi:AraC-like DNA-binding protein
MPCQQALSIEVGMLKASNTLSLAAHVHLDVQVSAVRTGWRIYDTPLGRFVAAPGNIVLIPPGLPHASHGEANSEVTHLYIPKGHPSACCVKVPQVINGSPALSPIELLDAIGSMRDSQILCKSPEFPVSLSSCVLDQNLAVSAIAKRLGLSTDGFIRAFKRQVGLTPAAYRNAHRLAQARLNLKSGGTITDAAYAASFADQSHLGRHFLRAYGTTPGIYRSAFKSI